MKTKNKSPYEEGRLAYIAGVSFLNNPWFGVSELQIKKWAKGWGDAQIKASKSD